MFNGFLLEGRLDDFRQVEHLYNNYICYLLYTFSYSIIKICYLVICLFIV